MSTCFSRRDLFRSAAAAGRRNPRRRHSAATSFLLFPTIIFILSDDHRYAMGFLHPQSWLRRPNLDALAREGAHLRNAFVTLALGSPGRASILTGVYAHLRRIVDNNTPIAPGTRFFPQLLQFAGYNGRLRDECLNANWFLNTANAKRKIQAWAKQYNKSRPHSSLAYLPPAEFAGGRGSATGAIGMTSPSEKIICDRAERQALAISDRRAHARP